MKEPATAVSAPTADPSSDGATNHTLAAKSPPRWCIAAVDRVAEIRLRRIEMGMLHHILAETTFRRIRKQPFA